MGLVADTVRSAQATVGSLVCAVLRSLLSLPSLQALRWLGKDHLELWLLYWLLGCQPLQGSGVSQPWQLPLTAGMQAGVWVRPPKHRGA